PGPNAGAGPPTPPPRAQPPRRPARLASKIRRGGRTNLKKIRLIGPEADSGVRHLLAAPQSRTRHVRPLPACLEFGPDNIPSDPLEPSERPKAAIGAGDDPLPIAYDGDGMLQSACDNLWMLHDVGGRINHAGQKNHVCRQRRCAERVVFGLMPGIGKLDAQSPDRRLEEHRKDLGQRNIVNVRSLPISPAAVKPD